MAALHFLNVRQGDCSIIKHNSGRVTVVDVNNARIESDLQKSVRESFQKAEKKAARLRGDFGQKHDPENPIVYMRERSMDSIFRFVLTHPDMDHMDGIKDLFEEFSPSNFWDTDTCCDKDTDDWENAPYREEDWTFYQSIRSSKSNPKRLTYLSGQKPCDFWKNDGLTILAPTKELLATADECGEWNDSSYVLLYRTNNFKTIIAGDSHDGTWEHILKNHKDRVAGVDVLVAPHHGRHSDRDFEFLDVLKPKLTLFGNAASEHLAYGAWNCRDLPIITNNQAGSIVIDYSDGSFFVTNEAFAKARNESGTYFDANHRAHFCGFIRE